MSPDTNSEVSDIPAKVILLCVIVIVAALSVNVLAGMQTNEETTVVVVNDTTTITALDTYYYLDNNATATTNWVRIVNSTVTVQNASGLILRTGNWTVDVTLGRIKGLTGGIINITTDYNVSYSYVYGSEARTQFGAGITALSTLMDWLDEIALVIAAVVILGLIMGMLVLVQTYKGRGGRNTL